MTSLTKFKRFKNSLAVYSLVALSHLPLSGRGLINLPKGFHATILLAQPKDSELCEDCEMFLLATLVCQFILCSHQSIITLSVILSVFAIRHINFYYRGCE